MVDDCSRDRTLEVLRDFAAARGVAWSEEGPLERGVELKGQGRQGKLEWIFLRHVINGGKGAAVRTALARADCDITVFHDADLEYHPRDLARIVKVFVEEQADAVFGSRFAGGEARRALLFRHELGNRFLTFLTNWVTNVNLTDMETCYKAVRTGLLKSIPLFSSDFRMEPELTIKLAKREARIFEVPISYSGRTYQEGKKINWRDGFKALWAILRFSLSDRVYADDEHGSQILGRLARAPRFNAWMADTIRPFCGRKVLEIGSGTGNLTRRLIPRDAYVASDINPLYLHTLRGLTVDRPYLDVTVTDVTRGDSFPQVEGGFDTVVCLNVIEHVDDDVGALRNIRGVLAPGGRAVVLVPHGPGILGTLDEVLGHRRRYTEATLRATLVGGGAGGGGAAPLQPRRLAGLVAQRDAPAQADLRALPDPGPQRPDAALPPGGPDAAVPAALAHRGGAAGGGARGDGALCGGVTRARPSTRPLRGLAQDERILGLPGCAGLELVRTWSPLGRRGV